MSKTDTGNFFLYVLVDETPVTQPRELIGDARLLELAI